jgi:hypothetical protein
MTQEYYDRYKAQSQELYTFLSRSFQDVFKFCEQPCLAESNGYLQISIKKVLCIGHSALG